MFIERAVKRRALLAVAVLAGAGLAGGCRSESSEPDGGKVRIGLIYKATTNPFFQAMEAGAREKARQLGVTLEVSGIESESDADKQADLVRIMVNRGVRAIVIAPASSVGIVTPLLRAQEAGIPIVNIDNRISADEAAKQGLRPATFVGPDNFAGARMVGARACDVLRSKLAAGATAQVIILRGIDGVENAEARRRGFEAAVKEAGLGIAASQSAEWDTAKAQTATAALLAAHPDAAGILCANDKMALGAIAAVKAHGRIGQVVIVGYDNIDLAREAIRRGEMQATVEQNPALMGALGVECALKAIRGEPLPEVTAVPVQLITEADVKGSGSSGSL